MPAIIVMSIWQAVGFHMVIWLPACRPSRGELYEAAAAGRRQPVAAVPLRHLARPAADPHASSWSPSPSPAFGLFAQVSVMTQGGPLDSTTTVVYQAVRTGYQQQETGYASAISLVFFVLVLIVSLVQRYLTREKD